VSEVHLSLVTPVFNGAGYIANNLRSIVVALEALQRPFEVIVVCDGSTDGSEGFARAVRDERVTVIHYPGNLGKGHAILYGLGQARGRLVGWLDSDLDIAPEAIVAAARRFDTAPVDAVVGSKRHPESSVAYPALRRVYSSGYQLLVRTLFRVNVRDTQVGAKVFRREMLDTVGPLVLVKRWAFDLEVLAVGAEFGFDRIEETAVKLRYRFSGTSINWHAVYRMLLDTLAIAYRIHVRHWYVRRFASLERHRMDEQAASVVAAERVLEEA
jgi:glycosyltransferase involved in cell wall biosynthesis